MRLNLKRVVAWCGGLSVALLAALSTGQSASAQEFIEVLPEIGAVTSRGVGAEGYYEILEERLPDPGPGFRAYNIWAQPVNAGQGRYVNALEQVNFTGVHQVWERTGPRTVAPTVFGKYYDDLGEFFGPAKAAEIKSFDSHLLFAEDQKTSGTGDPSETNNQANPSGMATDFGLGGDFVGVIGVGELGAIQRGAGASVALGLNPPQGGRLGLAKIVIWQGTAATEGAYAAAMMNGNLGGQANDSTDGEVDRFVNVAVGGSILVEVPEPSMGILALTSVLGLFGLRRRS